MQIDVTQINAGVISFKSGACAMNKTLIRWTSFLSVMGFSAALPAEEYARTDRYTLVSMEAQNDQSNPLTTITSVSLGRDINTVGDAINELLKGSGYRWQSPDSNDFLLHNLPLPTVVRSLGPLRLSDALQTLAGEAWLLRTDKLNRVVWFEVNQPSVNTEPPTGAINHVNSYAQAR